MNIILFGATGMLGNYIHKVLAPNYSVKAFTREVFDIMTADWSKLNNLLSEFNDNDVVINCAGIINQKVSQDDYQKYITVNTLFPLELERICAANNYKFIHISTNCVFSGKKGSYNECDQPDSNELYAVTKFLGEPNDCCLIRTSIIGEELFGKKSLLEWVRSNRNGQINGYSNVLWNGVTCLTLAKIINNIISNDLYWTGIRHIFSPKSVSKYELCQLINKIYDLKIDITEIAVSEAKNMTLSSTQIVSEVPILEEQIREQRNFNIIET